MNRYLPSLEQAITDTAIITWRFQDAPDDLRKLFTNGGDEDWLSFVPDALGEEDIDWMREGSSYGCFCVDEYPVRGGVVRIGSHS